MRMCEAHIRGVYFGLLTECVCVYVVPEESEQTEIW